MMSKIVMVRRELDQVIRIGSRLEPWGVVESIENVCSVEFQGYRFFSVDIKCDDGMRIALFYKISQIDEFVVVIDDNNMDKAIELCEYVVSESQRLSRTGSVAQVLDAAGLEKL